MLQLLKSNSHGSARRQIDLQGVRDGVLMLGQNHYRMILEVSSINFELKSEEEQDAIIETYESFLNSTSVPLQFLIRTREVDLDKYLGELGEKLATETHQIYRDQLQNYNEFIRGLIKNNKILTRRFYVIVPCNLDSNSDFEIVSEHLTLDVDIVRKGFHKLGMQSRVLTSVEVLDLFYSFYNPQKAKRQPIALRTLQLLQAALIDKEQQ